ncbi:MAG: tyrosine-type recombinase/integrase [Deferrisomatales bacterium]
MGTAKWTDLDIRNLKPEKTRYEKREGDGFMVRVSPTGVKSFYYLFVLKGVKWRLHLGEYDPNPKVKDDPTEDWLSQEKMGGVTLKEAHRRHADALAMVKKGINPILRTREIQEAERQKRAEEEDAEATRRAEEDAKRAAEDLAPTVAKLVDLYLEKWAKPRKRSWAEDERQLRKDLIPRLGHLKARDVERVHIREILEAVEERGAPVAANRLFAVLQKLFNWAAEKEHVKLSPCLGVKMPSEEVEKDRVLSPAEIRAFWQAVDTLPAPVVREGRPRTARREEGAHAVTDAVRRALKLVLVTAQRPGEVVAMRWDEIEGSWWTIPAGKAKNKLSHRVHLSKLALELLGPRGEGYVFPSPRKALGHIHRAALAHALRDNREALGIPEFSPHDLRRTSASLMAGAKVNPFTVERVLNHALHGVQKTYNRHSYDLEKREALDRWAARLEQIVSGEKAKVVPLRRKAKAGG